MKCNMYNIMHNGVSMLVVVYCIFQPCARIVIEGMVIIMMCVVLSVETNNLAGFVS